MPVPHERPITYFKISFLWAFYYLKNGYSYENAIKDIILKGGDTAMNAAIVGGLLGAFHGLQGSEGICKEMREAIISF